MKLSKDILTSLAEVAVKAALDAGKYIQSKTTKHPQNNPNFINQEQQKLDVQIKTGGSSLASQIFTEVDLESQRIILEHLKPTLKKYDLAILAEESTDNQSRFAKDYFWCIDPLDGTLPFVESQPGYAVCIALVSKLGEPILGIIFDPVKDNLYHAIKNQGAFKNREKWTPFRPEDNTQPITFICDRSFKSSKYYDIVITKLEKYSITQSGSPLKRIEFGGAAMNACWVLEHSPACYFKFPKKENGGGSLWDYAATACIFNELAADENTTKDIVCNASDIYGNTLDLNRKDSTFMNHRGVLFTSGSLTQKITTQIVQDSLL